MSQLATLCKPAGVYQDKALMAGELATFSTFFPLQGKEFAKLNSVGSNDDDYNDDDDDDEDYEDGAAVLMTSMTLAAQLVMKKKLYSLFLPFIVSLPIIVRDVALTKTTASTKTASLVHKIELHWSKLSLRQSSGRLTDSSYPTTKTKAEVVRWKTSHLHQ